MGENAPQFRGRDDEAKQFAGYDAQKYLAKEEWRPAAHAFYKSWPGKRRVMEWRRAEHNFNLGYEWEQKTETINELHGVDFLNVVIPEIIERVRASGSKRKIKILDMGCGLGFFNDQVRAKFGNDVDVFGTGINRSSLKKRKAGIIKDIQSGEIEMDPAEKAQLLSETDGSLHPNDAICNSIVQMKDFPEFDLVIDSEGEIIYAGGTGVGFFPKGDSTQRKLECAIRKLNPGGQLYVSRIHERHEGLTPKRREELSNQYGIVIEDNEEAHFPGALKITKN